MRSSKPYKTCDTHGVTLSIASKSSQVWEWRVKLIVLGQMSQRKKNRSASSLTSRYGLRITSMAITWTGVSARLITQISAKRMLRPNWESSLHLLFEHLTMKETRQQRDRKAIRSLRRQLKSLNVDTGSVLYRPCLHRTDLRNGKKKLTRKCKTHCKTSCFIVTKWNWSNSISRTAKSSESRL